MVEETRVLLYADDAKPRRFGKDELEMESDIDDMRAFPCGLRGGNFAVEYTGDQIKHIKLEDREFWLRVPKPKVHVQSLNEAVLYCIPDAAFTAKNRPLKVKYQFEHEKVKVAELETSNESASLMARLQAESRLQTVEYVKADPDGCELPFEAMLYCNVPSHWLVKMVENSKFNAIFQALRVRLCRIAYEA